MPCLTVLRMGWKWSLHFCQQAVSHTIAKATGDRLVEDREAGIVLDDHRPTCAAGHVDKFAATGIDKNKSTKNWKPCDWPGWPPDYLYMNLMQAPLKGNSLVWNSTSPRFSSRPQRLWRLRLALRALLRRGRASGKMFEILTGHATWTMLIRRESFSTLHHVYEFIHKHYSETVKLPASVRRELWQVSATLPLLRSDPQAQWHPEVLCSDASATGLGVVTQRLDSKEVGAQGRLREKWRFATEDFMRARSRALGKEESFAAAAEKLAHDEIKTITNFSDVRADWMEPSLWKVLHVGKLRHKEHITKSENRALVWSACRANRSRGEARVRRLFLVDNMSLCLAGGKGRSGSPALCSGLRILAALALATGDRFSLRWVPSERNMADGPSRDKCPDGSPRGPRNQETSPSPVPGGHSACPDDARVIPPHNQRDLSPEDPGQHRRNGPIVGLPGEGYQAQVEHGDGRQTSTNPSCAFGAPLFLGTPCGQGAHGRGLHSSSDRADQMVPAPPHGLEYNHGAGRNPHHLCRRTVLARTKRVRRNKVVGRAQACPQPDSEVGHMAPSTHGALFGSLEQTRPSSSEVAFPLCRTCSGARFSALESSDRNLLVQFKTYMHPGTLDRLRIRQLVAPNLDAGIQ